MVIEAEVIGSRNELKSSGSGTKIIDSKKDKVSKEQNPPKFLKSNNIKQSKKGNNYNDVEEVNI